MLWIKAFHVIFMVTWFAGLFYLPRLFVYHCEAPTGPEHARFCVMERKLYVISSFGMVLTWVFAIALIVSFPGYLQQGWLHAKIGLAVLLSGYHGWMGATRRKFANGLNTKSPTFYRWMNEVPAVFLVVMVILAEVKPF
jgi:putative membrane protein